MPNPTAPTNDLLFPALAERVWSKECVAVIGAGLSVPDYPSWKTLIDRLCERCDLRPEDAASDDPLDVAEAARVKSKANYFAALDEIFASVDYPKSATRYHMLARIQFKSYLTLNFDPLLVQILDCHRNVTVSDFPVLQSEHLGAGELFHLHGRLGLGRQSENTPLVLTRSDFEKAYSPYDNRLHSFLQQTFLDNHVCFIGCNPTEPNMNHLLNVCRKIRESEHGLQSPNKPRWFLLLDNESELPPGIPDSGIQVVAYSKVDPKYRGLDEVLEYLAKKERVCVRTSGPGTSPFAKNESPPS